MSKNTLTSRGFLPAVLLVLVPALALVPGLAWGQAEQPEAAPEIVDPLAKTPTLKSVSAEQVRSQVFAWLTEQKLDPARLAKAEQRWPTADVVLTGPQVLDRLASVAAVANVQAQSLVDFCSQPRAHVLLPDMAWLAKADLPPILRDNLRLYYGRWLSRERFYDEALEQLAELKPEQVVDPSTLLFNQGVANHRLLHKAAGLAALSRLLDDVSDCPTRYRSVAQLMHYDLTQLKDESLDHISRQMGDIERRLEFGRAGKKVRKVEDDVVAALDKMIKELEKNGGGGGGGGGAGGGGAGSPNGIRSTAPASDSAAAGGRGEGNVDRKNIGSKSGWGDLPPREREKALQDIGKNFPAHYSEIIERFFRKIASEGSDRAPK